MKPGSWGLILVIFFMTVICGASAGKMIPLLPDMARDFNISMPTAAWLISAVTVISVVIAPFSGVFSDKFGDKTILIVGLLVLVVSNIANYLAPNFTSMMVSRTIEGIAFISIALGAVAMMARTAEGQKLPIAMSIVSVGVPLGVGLGLVFAGFVAGPNWKNAFLWHAALGTICVIVALFLPKAEISQQNNGSQPDVNWFKVALTENPFRLALGGLLNTIVMFGFGMLFTTFAVETHHLSPQQAAGFGILSYPASVIGSLAIGKMMEKNGNLRTMIIGVVVLTTIFGSLIFMPALGLQLSAASLFFFYLFGGMLGAMAVSRFPAASPSPATIGITASLFMQFANAGMLISPPIVMYVYKSFGAYGTSLLAFVCLGLTLLAWMTSKISPTGKEA